MNCFKKLKQNRIIQSLKSNSKSQKWKVSLDMVENIEINIILKIFSCKH